MRYSVRTLLIGVSLVACVCGIGTYRSRLYDNDLKAAAEICRKGGGVFFVDDKSQWFLQNEQGQYIQTVRSPIDRILAVICAKETSCVRGVSFDGLQFGDDDIDLLQKTGRLERVDLYNSAASKDGITRLGKLSQLQCVIVSGTNLDDECVASLCQLKRLEILMFEGNGISDQSVDSLRKLNVLRVLVVDGSAISRDGRARLRSCLPQCSLSFND